jgi:hypothetical protein
MRRAVLLGCLLALAAAAAESPPPEPDIPPAEPDGLAVSPDGAPASAATSHPCELSNCGVVLSISGEQRWQIEVQMHDGSVHVFEQDYRPAFQIGDPVLVDGRAVFLWN